MAKRKEKSAQEPPKPIVFVVGPRDSAVSDAAHVLGCSGFLRASEDVRNAVATVHSQILDATGRDALDWKSLPKKWQNIKEIKELTGDVENHIDTFGSDEIHLVDCAHLTRLWPLWQAQATNAGLSPHVVLVLNNPMDTASDLAETAGLTAQGAHLVWLRHMLEIEHATRNVPRVTVRHDDLIQNWPGTLTRIATSLSLDLPRDPSGIQAHVEAKLPSGHLHVRQPDALILENPLLPQWLRDSYGIFARWAARRERKNDYARLDAILTAFDEAAPAFSGLSSAPDNQGMTSANKLSERLERETDRAQLLQAERDQAQAEADTLHSRLSEAQSALLQKDAELDDTAKALKTAREALETAERKQLDQDAAAAELNRAREEAEARVRHLAHINETLDTAIKQTQTALETLSQADRSAESEAKELRAQLLASQSEKTRIETALSDQTNRMDEARAHAKHLSAATQTARAAQADIGQISALLLENRGRGLWLSRRRQFQRDRKTLLQSGLFDAQWYQQTNSDVAEAGVDPASHFLRNGMAEGRAPRPAIIADTEQ